jgi:hypothetical protein
VFRWWMSVSVVVRSGGVCSGGICQRSVRYGMARSGVQMRVPVRCGKVLRCWVILGHVRPGRVRLSVRSERRRESLRRSAGSGEQRLVAACSGKFRQGQAWFVLSRRGVSRKRRGVRRIQARHSMVLLVMSGSCSVRKFVSSQQHV